MTFAPKTWQVGEVVTAAMLNTEIRDQLNSMFGAWTAYTPTWTAVTTNPALGNGSLVGRYMKIGRTVFCNINLVAGSTTTFGSGNYSWSLPAQAASAGMAVIGSGQLINGSNRYAGYIVVASGVTTTNFFVPTSTTSSLTDFLTGTRPETLAATAQIRLSFVYEAAS